MTCIICGADVDGHICRSHEEDVYFEFEGRQPEQLTPDRFYRGTVDGFADFGVFVDIGDNVTGLLHRSELDRRLESLDWEPGDTVFVQVKNVRDNGDVDLGWSIRQHASEFRGKLIDAPDGDRLPDGAEEESGNDDAAIEPGPVESRTGDGETPDGPAGEDEETPDGSTGGDDHAEAGSPGGEPEKAHGDEPGDAHDAPTGEGSDGPAAEDDSHGRTADGRSGGATEEDPAGAGGAALQAELERTPVADLGDLVGRPVRIEGRVVEARQTSGPTVFEVRDETGAVDCAAFESAGVRAYPEVGAGDVVRIEGELEERRGDLQIETERLERLEGGDREAVERRLEEALEERARPESVDLLADHPAVDDLREDLRDAATAIRRAVFDARPVVVRHNASVDGYVAGAAIERALLPLVRGEHEESDAEYHYVDRRPLDGRIYGMDDAMRDTTDLLEAGERHGEKVPLFVFVHAGSTEESRDGFDLLDLYGADRVVIDGDRADGSMADAADAFVSAGGTDANTTALAANVAAAVNPEVRDDLRHLPAVSYWRDVPEAYRDLAAEAGHEDAATLREALALEAFYQAYEDKRELIADLLFGERDLAARAAEQFRERVDREIRTAESHLEEWSVGGATLATLDLEAFTHRYEFPPAEVLLAELAERSGADAVLGVDEDELLVWDDRGIDVRAVGEAVAEEVPEAGVETRGGADGHLVFLSGERDAVVAATVEALGEAL